MTVLTPQEFATKWAGVALSERSSYQQHFLDLCANAAVFAAYGWPEDIADDEILRNLLALNGERV